MKNRQFTRWIIFLVGIVNISIGQEVVPKPKFPSTFQVEIEGFVNNTLAELDGSLYYDRENNRAALAYTFQNERSKFIYNFDDNEVLSFDGFSCSVEKIPDNPVESFFTFTKNEKTGKKVIASPEEILFFTNSVLQDKAPSDLPVYTYVAKRDFPFYRLKNCDVQHTFTNPKVQTPDCDSHRCQPKLTTISVFCEAQKGEEGEEEEGEEEKEEEEDPVETRRTYNFIRFKQEIDDEGVFQPPPGVYCNATSRQEFPQLPDYISFSYDYQEEIVDYQKRTSVFSTHKKIWYDSLLRLIRLDEFDENGLIVSSRILDFYGEMAFTIISHLGECETLQIEEDTDLAELTRLPGLIFQRDIYKGDAVYVGKKKAHGIEHDVWVSQITNSETDAVRVEEFFFSQVMKDGSTDTRPRLSHVDIYIYERNHDSGEYELSANAFYALNNFRSEPKEWKAFDISPCFEHDHKKAFKLEVEGPSVVKNSLEYENLLEKLYMKIIIHTNVSITRVSDLTDIHDGTHLKGFNGWILEKPNIPGVNASELEPGMTQAYDLLKKASSLEKLNIKIKFSKRDVQYKIKLIEDKSSPHSTPDWAIAAIVVLTVVAVFVISCWILYVFKKKKEDSSNDQPLSMSKMY